MKGLSELGLSAHLSSLTLNSLLDQPKLTRLLFYSVLNTADNFTHQGFTHLGGKGIKN